MSDLLDFSPPGQVEYSLAGAKASFFNAGTTTPRAVFFDQGQSLPVPVPLLADGNGIFPQVFAGGAAVKVVVTRADDSAAYTLDPCVKVAASGAAAGAVTFTPSNQLPFNNVQAAIDGLASQVSGQGQSQAEGNRVINGAMQFWQRGTSFTLSSPSTALTADRWRAGFFGGSFGISRQNVPLGTKFGQNNPKFVLRMSISGQTDAVNHNASLRQQIEDVRTFAGETITVLGWARRESGTGDMAIDVFQNFGTGGPPLPDQFGIGQRVVLATSWQPFACVFNVPDVTGRTLGTNGNDHLAIRFHASAGSIANAQTANLGLQAIGIELWGIHVRRGTFAASAVNTYVMPNETEELIRCQRYLQTGTIYGFGSANSAANFRGSVERFRTTMRIPPQVSPANIAYSNSSNLVIEAVTANGFGCAVAVPSSGPFAFDATYTADAEI